MDFGPLYLTDAHTLQTRARAHTRRRQKKLVVSAAAAREFINKIVSQLKSYMTFLSSEVLEAVQLKDLLLDAAAEHC